MVLTPTLWHELIDLGLLDGAETCALCPAAPHILLDVAKAPVLLCPTHARNLVALLQADLQQLNPSAHERH